MTKIVKAADDLDWAQGTETPADCTRILRIDEIEVELDLTTAHADELDKLLDPYLRVGKRLNRPPAARPGPRGKGRAYNAGMRAYADARGISYRQPGTGKIQYTAPLKREYAEYLAGQNSPYQPAAGTVTPGQ